MAHMPALCIHAAWHNRLVKSHQMRFWLHVVVVKGHPESDAVGPGESSVLIGPCPAPGFGSPLSTWLVTRMRKQPGCTLCTLREFFSLRLADLSCDYQTKHHVAKNGHRVQHHDRNVLHILSFSELLRTCTKKRFNIGWLIR